MQIAHFKVLILELFAVDGVPASAIAPLKVAALDHCKQQQQKQIVSAQPPLPYEAADCQDHVKAGAQSYIHQHLAFVAQLDQDTASTTQTPTSSHKASTCC
jgi:hypothetical protein